MKGDMQISICVNIPQDSCKNKGVFFLHSFNGCKLGPGDMFPYIADQLSFLGVYGIRFDCVGNGESDWHENVGIESRADDVAFVIKYVCKEYGISYISLVTISNSASLVFYLNELSEKIDSIIFLSPIFMHVKIFRKLGSTLYSRLIEYVQKFLCKGTYVKIIHGEIDLKSVFMVLRESVYPSNNVVRPVVDKSKLLKAIRCIHSVLVIGSHDPHCKKNLAYYRSFAKENKLNWDMNIIQGASHNFISLVDRKKIVDIILKHICTAV